VLIAWQYFYNMPRWKSSARSRRRTSCEALAAGDPRQHHAAGGAVPSANAPANNAPASAAPVVSRDAAIGRDTARQNRHPARFRQHLAEGCAHRRSGAGAVPRNRRSGSPPIVLYSPSNTANPYLRGFGWVPAAGSTARISRSDHGVEQDGSGSLTPTSPVTLKYDNGEGLTFRRTIAIDERYLFTVKDEVTQCRRARSRSIRSR